MTAVSRRAQSCFRSRSRALVALDHLESVEPGEVVSEGARVEIRRADVVEWYANSPRGLEQGFTP